MTTERNVYLRKRNVQDGGWPSPLTCVHDESGELLDAFFSEAEARSHCRARDWRVVE